MSRLAKIVAQNKKALILIIGVGLFLSLVPLHFAQAQENWWDYPALIFDYFLTLPLRTGALFVAIPLAIIAVATGILYTIITVLLGWFKAIILSVPILPAEVGVVDAGWEITRNLANMGFILILVFIGLATILRIKDYEAKKLLPTLIGVALLINFSPVIVGFIVDVSNIITNFFLNLGSWQSTVTAWSIIGNYFEEVFKILVGLGPIWSVLGNVVGTLIFGVVLILFFGYSAWIYLLVAALLVVRIIVLWILMILAPLAFLFYVLPAGRKLAKEWWQQLVQWAIVAIPLGFFLFLSFKVLEFTAPTSQINTIFKMANLKASTSAAIVTSNTMNASTTASFGGFTGQLADAFGVMLVPLISIIILHIGYKLSRRYMPAAANAIIGNVEKGMKMVAGSALVAATGGAAAGLAVKGLGGVAKIATRMEAGAAKMPGGKVWSKALKPASWATRGMERAATPALLEHQAKTRKVSDKELEKIDKMAPADAEAYINAKTKMLPGGLKKQQRGQYMARMADKEMLEFTSSEFRTEAGELANEIREKENPYYQKEATTIAKALPETVSEEAQVHSKLVGMPDKTPEDKAARNKKEAETREEIRETQDIIQNRIGRENFTIEAALQLKYVTKDDVERDRAAALAEIQRRAALKPGELEQTQRNIAASATFTKELKPEDMKKMIDPDNFATRVGISLGNPRNLQRIQDNFGIKKLKAVIGGKGGLNDATNSPEKLDEFSKINPQMVNAILSSPAYRELDIEARKHMLDPNGQPTTNFDAFRRGGDIQGTLTKSPNAIKSFYKLHTTAASHQRRIEELQMRGQPTAQREKLLDSTLQQIASRWPQIEKSEPLRNKWLDIEKMRNPQEAEVLQRDVEAGLRVEGIINTEPLLARFDNLHRIAEEHERKKIKAARAGKHQTALRWSRYETSARSRIRSMQTRINRDDRLKEKWEEIETLRRGKPIKEKPPRQPRGPQRGGGGSTTGGGGPTPRGGGPTPRGPAQTPPPPSPSRQPKPPSTPQQPSQQRPPSRSTPTTPAPAPPETPSKGPAWFAAGIESIRGGKIPTIIPKKLENLLHSNGFRRSEINKMKPAEAWAKAEEIIKKEKK